MKTLMIAAAWAVLGAGMASAAPLYDNGPVADATGRSILVTPPGDTLGWLSSINSNAGLADDFTVGAGGWTVGSIDFYAYQTNANGFTFTNVRWSVLSGADPNTGTVVASGTTAVTNGGVAGYRVTDDAPNLQNRAIYRLNADMSDFALAAGSYFLTWQLAGTSSSGPFVPPVVGSEGTGNAFQSFSSPFAPARDAVTQATVDFPFTINGPAGPAVPEPGTWAMMIAGFGLAGGALRRRARIAFA